MEHTLIVAGIGPGDPDYILPKAQKAIEGAHYLVGGRRALSDYAEAFSGNISGDRQALFAGKLAGGGA